MILGFVKPRFGRRLKHEPVGIKHAKIRLDAGAIPGPKSRDPGTGPSMPRSTKPFTLVRPCVVCRKPFQAPNPQRICCGSRCRRVRLRARQKVGAPPWISDEAVFAALTALSHARSMRPEIDSRRAPRVEFLTHPQ